LGADGHLAIALSRPLLAGIASILFGLEEDGLDEPTLSDTLLEIANIIAGRFLQKVHGARSDFILGLPSAFGDEAAWDRFPVRLAFSAGPGRALAVGLSPGAGT
jgi:CheY-specific phosphatase CheX